MKNLCKVCGGGFGSHIAPEARCKCDIGKKKEREELRQELINLERKYLMKCGWTVSEKFNNAKEGFFWNAKTGEGPFPQMDAISIQKKWDMDPGMQKWVDLQMEYNSLEERIQKRTEEGLDVSSLRTKLEEVSLKMLDLTNAKKSKIDGPAVALPPSC